ncbi:MAG: hypothetical protein HYU84_06565 [Chloroflexi bacterium]|nr:hypothetical protein [Chloroflexota bacterium]MBI3167002.1 hypothetical protein [Chloroflexota bacterium]
MEYLLTSSPIPGMLLWIILYISDYYMTLAVVKAYKDFDAIKFEKSMELTPQFQKDVEGQALVSKRHVILLLLFTLLILAFWYLAVGYFGWTWLYSFLLGLLILLEVAVHMRHFRNGYQIRVLRREGGITGGITFSQRFSYLTSAFDFYAFAVLFFLFFLLSFSPFFLGGAIACFRVGLSHGGFAKKAAIQTAPSMSQHADSSSR